MPSTGEEALELAEASSLRPMPEPSLPSCDVLGVRCFVGDTASAANAAIEHALTGSGGYGVLCNVHVLMTAGRDPEVMAAVEGAWVVFPDGAPVAWFQRRAGTRQARRVGGPDLMSAVVDRGRAYGLRHALLGSTPDVVTALVGHLRERFPGVEIVVAHAPARGEEDDEVLLAQVTAARPHVVWCALGAPKQELWMARRASELAPALVLGVGAAFDFHAGVRARAPEWMQRSGIEWLHRLTSEPKRLFRRYLATNTAFVLEASRALLTQRVSRRQTMTSTHHREREAGAYDR